MRYADRDGNIYEEENGQDRLLHWMYTLWQDEPV